ncbi:unnamed protein product [Mortierella alpina]
MFTPCDKYGDVYQKKSAKVAPTHFSHPCFSSSLIYKGLFIPFQNHTSSQGSRSNHNHHAHTQPHSSPDYRSSPFLVTKTHSQLSLSLSIPFTPYLCTPSNPPPPL